MAVSVFYTNMDKARYAGEVDLVTVSAGKCAARVTLTAVPADASSVYAEIFAPMEGQVTSFALRLASGAPVGEAILTTVSPELDLNGAFMYAFLEGIKPATVGPAMYRKTDVHSAFYCTDKTDKPQKIFVIITGASGLDGVSADVSMWVKAH